jgi:signal peptidase I
MSKVKTEKTKSRETLQKDKAAEIANTFEWLITAFILAILFMAFVMQAFQIPTGSMADTLKGSHFRLCCPQCGYKYNYGFDSSEYDLSRDAVPSGSFRPPRTCCPSCGHYPRIDQPLQVANGDRILVLKCIYQFFEPMRWDVIVFKNPLDPSENYIKRLVALPGETVEIIDGDVYINRQIARKPPNVRNELWMPVYDNDYQPIRPNQGSFNGHPWRQPFDTTGSNWQIPEDNPTSFRLDSPSDQINTIVYDTSIGNNFRTTYAYDDVRRYPDMPYCSDLMVRFYCLSSGPQGRIGIGLSKYQTHYSAWVDFTGEMVIEAARGSENVELASKSVGFLATNKPALIKFANVDHQLIFEFGTEKLIYDLGRGANDAGERRTDIQPRVEIFGSGRLVLSHVAIFRDTHYTNVDGPGPARATQGNPFTLQQDEFFVLGDNSPNSADGRWWNRPGRANNGLSYHAGVVPRDYLVGKALFVYWPSGFRPFARFGFSVIPNVGQMRFIYGGSDKEQ